MLHERGNGVFEVAAIKSTIFYVSDTDIREHSFKKLLQSLVFVANTKPDGNNKQQAFVSRCDVK